MNFNSLKSKSESEQEDGYTVKTTIKTPHAFVDLNLNSLQFALRAFCWFLDCVKRESAVMDIART